MDDKKDKKVESADEPSDVVKNNKKLDKPKRPVKGKTEEPKKQPEKHEKTKLKFSKRTHRTVDNEDTSHD